MLLFDVRLSVCLSNSALIGLYTQTNSPVASMDAASFTFQHEVRLLTQTFYDVLILRPREGASIVMSMFVCLSVRSHNSKTDFSVHVA